MGKPKPNPYLTTSDLIANAIGTAKVFGENRRITNLVASSIGRLILEMDGSGEGDELLAHALSCINAQDAEHVPALYSALNALSVLIE
ncbi:hypothetical protein GALL_36830 [mine drainage metagenome]|uniref:Uncharacterized protein n=1 Tax=mine drainage metagenome TaxID=410659 RepID=A0A1J5T394_9ZZZZ